MGWQQRGTPPSTSRSSNQATFTASMRFVTSSKTCFGEVASWRSPDAAAGATWSHVPACKVNATNTKIIDRKIMQMDRANILNPSVPPNGWSVRKFHEMRVNRLNLIDYWEIQLTVAGVAA